MEEIRPYGRKVCSILECDGKHLSKNYCRKHYWKFNKYGDPLAIVENTGKFKPKQEPWNKGLKGTHFSPSTEFKKGEVANEKHPQWKGEKPGYFAVHYWIRRHWDKPNKCEHCGTTEAKRFEWANISGEYKRVRGDWLILCTSCHHIYDDIYTKGKATKEAKKWASLSI